MASSPTSMRSRSRRTSDDQSRQDRLNAASQLRAAAALAAAHRAITLLDARGLPVTFAAVASEAGVSLAYVYKNETIAERIRELRAKPDARRPKTRNQVHSDRGLQTKLDAALARNDELEAENARLLRENRNLLSRLIDPSYDK